MRENIGRVSLGTHVIEHYRSKQRCFADDIQGLPHYRYLYCTQAPLAIRSSTMLTRIVSITDIRLDQQSGAFLLDSRPAPMNLQGDEWLVPASLKYVVEIYFDG